MRKFGYWLQDNFLALIGFIGLTLVIVVFVVAIFSLKEDPNLYNMEEDIYRNYVYDADGVVYIQTGMKYKGLAPYITKNGHYVIYQDNEYFEILGENNYKPYDMPGNIQIEKR